MHYYNLIGQPQVLTPHWFDDSCKTQRVQPVDRYLFPEPSVFKSIFASPSTSRTNPASTAVSTLEEPRQSDKDVLRISEFLEGKLTLPSSKIDLERREDNRAILSTVVTSSGDSFRVPSSQQDGVWVGRRVLLSNSLDLASGRRESVNIQIEAGNGVVVDPDDEDAAFDILIITNKDNDEYRNVCRNDASSLRLNFANLHTIANRL